MSTELHRAAGIVVTQCGNGAGQGTRLEIMVENGPGFVKLYDEIDALALAGGIMQWVANARGARVTVVVDPTHTGMFKTCPACARIGLRAAVGALLRWPCVECGHGHLDDDDCPVIED